VVAAAIVEDLRDALDLVGEIEGDLKRSPQGA